MKKILGFFTNRWFVSALGLIMISAIIFYAGPLFGFGDSRPLASVNARLITILIIVILWMLNQLRKALVANRANTQMVESLVEDESAAEPDRSAEELETLGKRFEEAVEVLKKSKGKRGSLNLYDLPWYIIIGPPGSGKTTALVNSGLDFPLAERFGKEALRGVGGTRDCDWWFTEEAILLDTAGRYTTQDSDATVDSTAWDGFLELLKKYRKRRPINGVLIAISLADLMTQSEGDRLAHARAIKSRVQELDNYFGIRFPVYVVLTKCDLVAGFTEFFDDLGRAEREQILGTTFSFDESSSETGAVDRFEVEFDAILERLSSRLLWRLSGERDIRRRAAIYGFPRQLASLIEPISSFLGDVFRGSRFEQAPMLRGIYLTSGTQEGTPIDRLMGTVARTFGLEAQMLPAHGGQGRSYFITSLFKKVIFTESEIAGTNRRLEKQRAWLQRAAYAGSIALTALIIVGWVVSYVNNKGLINEVAAATEEAANVIDDVPLENLDPLVVLPALDATRSIPGGSGAADGGARLFSRLGLYQGNKLGTQADSAYRRVLVEILLPRLILRMENQLRGGGPSPDFQYEALKAYLMLDSRDHYDLDEIAAWIRFDLMSNMRREINTVQRDSLFAHLDSLFAEQPLPLPLPLDQNLIEVTQRVVARMPTEERVYSRLKRKSMGEELPPFTLFGAAGPRSQIVFARKSRADLNEGIPGLYTRDGYQRVFVKESMALTAELIDESWILGPYTPPTTDSALLMSRVKDLYLDDFARQYEGLVLDIELAPFSTPQEAVNILNILSDPVNSPLLLLLQGIQRETQLDSLPGGSGEEDDSSSKAAQKLEQLLGKVKTPAPLSKARSQLNRVQNKFRWVDQLVGGDDPNSAPIQHLLGLIEELYRFMATVVSQQGPAGDIPAHVAGQGQAVIQQLQMEASRQPEMLQNLLSGAAGRSQNLAFAGVASQINTEWQSRGLPFCRQAISGRYPIARNTSQEIRLDDFGQFFGPGGITDTFFKDYLANYVDMSRSPWRVRSSGAVPIRISQNALRQFERAHAIRETFFRGGGDTPSVRFEMRPIGMDATISQFSLSLAGKSISYSFGPQITEYMEWPGPDQNGEVRIEMSPPTPGGASMLRERGPWAWFRLLDKANISAAGQPEHFQVEFKLGDRSAAYELIARSAYNPFRFDELEQFRCPETL
jgi:type VI secretion system protein ImpL